MNGMARMTAWMMRSPVPDSRSSGSEYPVSPAAEGEDQQQHPDDPVQVAWPAEGAGEEHAGHVQGDGADEDQCRPVVHLADQQAALHVERDAQHRVVGGRHLDAL